MHLARWRGMLGDVMSDVIEQAVCAEVFAPWDEARRVVESLALEPMMAAGALRHGPGLLAREEAERIAAWFSRGSYAPAQSIASEYATWLQCRTVFSLHARPAAFTELVGAVTTFVASGTKPTLRADLPPEHLLA